MVSERQKQYRENARKERALRFQLFYEIDDLDSPEAYDVAKKLVSCERIKEKTPEEYLEYVKKKRNGATAEEYLAEQNIRWQKNIEELKQRNS